MNVLITLHPGYGIGDAVQMSAVLRHVAKYRPMWEVDYGAEEGKHQAGRDIVARTFALGKPYPSDHYDAEVQILLYDTYAAWTDRPNTRVVSCLHERFGLDWDAECARYQVSVSREVGHEVCAGLSKFMCRRRRQGDVPVAIHYQGDTAPHNKDLSHAQADRICDFILGRKGYSPLLLDWRNTSPVANRIDVCSTGRECFSRDWGRCVERNTAIIAQCAAFVGIDSGPAKCASVTNVPALVVWTGHHPAVFHDPAPNTTHLVPVQYNDLVPVKNNYKVREWFEANHKVRFYQDDPVLEVCKWLSEALG